MRLNKVPQDRGIDLSGTYSFSPAFTQGPNANRGVPTVGDSVASLLLGTPASGSFCAFPQVEGFNDYYGLYLQGDWRITRKLTLNLGLRYELERPRTERLDRLEWFDYNVLSPLNERVKGRRRAARRPALRRRARQPAASLRHRQEQLRAPVRLRLAA